MSQVLEAIQNANRLHAENFGEKGKLPMPPARHLAILTCMDARLDPDKFAGLAEGDAHVIRNAGGRASDDAIRSLVISYKLLGILSSDLPEKLINVVDDPYHGSPFLGRYIGKTELADRARHKAY